MGLDLNGGFDFSSMFHEWEFEKLTGVEPDDPNELWEGMPEFENEPQAEQTIHVHFENREAVELFSGLIGQALTEKTRSIWYPERESGKPNKLRIESES